MGHFDDTKTTLSALLRDLLAALNPVTLWQAFQEADEGVCVMAPARVRVRYDQRRR